MVEERERPLGWRPGPVNEADRPMLPELERVMKDTSAPKQFGTKAWYSPLTLKQWVGSCVGHGAIHVYNSSPGVHRVMDDKAMEVYDLAQRKYDPWEDTPPEEGTSVRAGAQAMVELGYWESFAMAYNHEGKTISVEDLARWILNRGPVMMGIGWKQGYSHPREEDDYFIQDTGRDQGGHNIEVDAVRFRGNPETDWFRMHQTWGDPWGYRAYGHGGFCRVSYRLMETILRREWSTVCSPVEV